MKNILLESTKSKFKVLEHKPANVLKRIQGVLSDFKSNRNGRIYPRELWENVLNSDYVKEMIESHGLVGELDHPEERLEISLQNVSHVINDMWIEGDQVVGTIDILPTPSGKIVSELLDYGTDIGISSRGAGSVGPDNVVDPDYQFVTFDFVARPSCEAARLNMIVESVQPEIDNNSDDKVKNILEGYKTSLKKDIFKNYYNKPALPAPGEEELYGYDLSDVCDNVEKYFGLKNKREALNKIVEEHLDKKVIDEVMKYSSSNLKEGHSQEDINMMFVDMCKDALSDELGPDWRHKSLSDIEDIVHSTVYKYNEANVQPEYEDEEFYGDEVNANTIYQYILDNEIPKENKTTETRPMNEEVKPDISIAIDILSKLSLSQSSKINRQLMSIVNKLRDIEYEINRGNLTEAVMSDQEVYKTVLEWYKSQIENGKMTLNQCYELLSDKAKVSLNKMVDQSKIKESMIDATINKLIKESIELNKKNS